VFLRDGDIARRREVVRKEGCGCCRERRNEKGMWKGREERRGRSLYSGGRRSGSGALAAINAGADGHAAMHDETRHCAARSVSYGAGTGSERQIPYCFASDGNCF
jgi:hypothetical protein